MDNEISNYIEQLLLKMPCYVYWKDKNYRYMGCNELSLKLLDFKSDKELIGKTDYELGFDVKLADRYRAADKFIFKTGRPKLNVEEIFVTKQGKKIILLTNKIPIRNQSDEIIGLLGVSLDITKRKMLEEKLRLEKENSERVGSLSVWKLTTDIQKLNSSTELEREKIHKILENISHEITGREFENNLPVGEYVSEVRNYFESIIAKMPCYVYWKDRNFRYLGCNEKTLEIIGMSSLKQVVGKTDYDFGWDKHLVDAYREQDKKIIETALPKLNFEETLINKEGKKFDLLVNKMPLFDSRGEVIGIVGITVDITERKQMEKELKSAKEAAEKAHEAEEELRKTKYQLEGAKLISGSIAHEIRTPLVTIKSGILGIDNMFSKLMVINQFARDKKLPVQTMTDKEIASVKKAFNWIEQKVDQSNLIINMLLTKLQKVSFEFSEFTVCTASKCIQNAIKEFILPDTMIKKLIFNKDNDFEFMGNGILIMHVIMNLIKNATFYILKAGKGEITIWMAQQDNHNEIHFKDTGTGISPQILPHIFDSFFTTESSIGTGIGLAFSKMVMQSHQGKIECLSKEGEYTEFILSFPKLTRNKGKGNILPIDN